MVVASFLLLAVGNELERGDMGPRSRDRIGNPDATVWAVAIPDELPLDAHGVKNEHRAMAPRAPDLPDAGVGHGKRLARSHRDLLAYQHVSPP